MDRVKLAFWVGGDESLLALTWLDVPAVGRVN